MPASVPLACYPRLSLAIVMLFALRLQPLGAFVIATVVVSPFGSKVVRSLQYHATEKSATTLQSVASSGWRCSAEYCDGGAAAAKASESASGEKGLILSYGDVQQSPRLWMEELEATEEGRGDCHYDDDDDGGDGSSGVYTVIRCELPINRNSKRRWKIWGQTFHIGRMRDSYLLKYHRPIVEDGGTIMSDLVLDSRLGVAATESSELMERVLREAEEVLLAQEEETGGNYCEKEKTKPVVMLTLLWTKEQDAATTNSMPTNLQRGMKDNEKEEMRVRAHGSIVNVPSPQLNSLPPGIRVAIALPPATNGQRDWMSLPSRWRDNNPRVKDSSWCRRRRPLEASFKADGIGEVVLARDVSINFSDVGDVLGDFAGIELLEGLTSNLFVIYKDGTFRTADCELVLEGYARSLVLKVARRLGLEYNMQEQIMLQDAVDGKWAEVFVTSSVRLVLPVTSVVVPEYSVDQTGNGNARSSSYRGIWTRDNDVSDEKSYAARVYEEILNAELFRE